MSARLSGTKVGARGLEIHAACRVHNISRETWRAQDGFAFSYHVLDPETNVVIEDGPRTAPGRDIHPGESETVEIRFQLPPDAAHYRVFVSPMREQAGWFYERGSEFLLLDLAVEGGEVKIGRAQVFTMRRLRWELFLRSLGRALTLPWRAIWVNRSLIRAMVRRDIVGRYRGSFGGIFWTVLNPLLLMLTYFFVFGIVLQARFGNDPSRSSFVLYFLAGMLPWLAFSEAAGRAPFVLLEYRNFVRKLVFPVETLPVNLVAAGLVTEAFAVVLFLAGLLLARGAVPVTALWLPALLAPQILFTLGFCWFLAGLGVFVRDLGQVSGFLLTLWFFLTPICYPEESLPAAALPILSRNPVYVLVRGYRDILLEGRAPDFGPLWKLWLLGAVVFILGYAWFHKLRRSFADVI
jgi:lipopolysaccharide transport system permease protein